MVLEPSVSPEVFFEATTPGVFSLVLIGNGTLYLNSDSLGLSNLGNGQRFAVLYMNAEDTLSYSGAAASTLAGVRLGDEFSE